MNVIFSAFIIFATATLYIVAAIDAEPEEIYDVTDETIIELPRNGLYAEECLKETQVPEEDVKKLKGKDISNASDKLQCYLNCVMEKDEIIFDGILNEDVMYDRLQNVTALNDEDTTRILNICKSIEGEDRCDISYRLSKCFIEHKANPILWRIATVV